MISIELGGYFYQITIPQLIDAIITTVMKMSVTTATMAFTIWRIKHWK